MTLGSLFDGIGGWQLAAARWNIENIWGSEIDSFCCSVTKTHFPDTKQLGDICKLADTCTLTSVQPVDIICAGSPCQGLSLMGKMQGLRDRRSGLLYEAFMKPLESLKNCDLESLSGKTFPEPLNQIMAQTSKPYLRTSSARGFQCLLLADGKPAEWQENRGVSVLNGGFWTPDISECPKDGEESSLSSILQEKVSAKYYLPKEAAQSVLTRAAQKGRQLPEGFKRIVTAYLAIQSDALS